MKTYRLDASDIERLLARFEIDEHGCWLWTSRLFTQTGYSCITVLMDDGRWSPTVAHRAMYMALVGPIPDGLHIDHLCRVRACVNPDHLEPVTQRENTMRGENQTARQVLQTACIHGHPFTEENTYRKPGKPNKRECRQCNRERDAARDRRGYTPPSRRKVA